MSCPNTTVCSSRTWAEHRKVPLGKFGTPFPSWEGAPRQARDTISFVGRCPSASSGHHFLSWEGAPRQARDTISLVGRCPSTSSGHHFLRGKVPLGKLGTPFPCRKVPLDKLGTPFPSSEMVEAGGVEPPSEKRYDTKPTCLAQF